MQESFDAVYKELRSALWTINGSTDALSDIANRLKKAHEAELCEPRSVIGSVTHGLRVSMASGIPGELCIGATAFRELCDEIDSKYTELRVAYRRLMRGHLKLPVDMNGIPCLVGDRMIVRHGPYRDDRFTVVGIGRDDSLIAMNSKGEATMFKAIDCAHIVFSTTSDVIDDAMRWVRTNDYGTSSCEWADMLSASAERIDAINEGRNQ